MFITCICDSNNFMWLTRVCHRYFYLIVDGSHEDYWNKIINVFVSALASNLLRMHNKRTSVHCPRMLMWCSLLLLVAITAIKVHAVHSNFLCRSLQTCETIKILDRSYKIHKCDLLSCFKFKSSCTVRTYV